MSRKFFVESEFLESYDRARRIAQHWPNWIDAIGGDDLLGVPALDDHGSPLTDEAGTVVWRRPPVSGWVPLGGSWTRVPFLAPELQSTLIRTDQHGQPVVSMRITPEVRKERDGQHRVLTFEWAFQNDALEVTTPIVDGLLAEAMPLIRAWYPLHIEMYGREWRATPPQQGVVTSVMARLRGPHWSAPRPVLDGQGGAP